MATDHWVCTVRSVAVAASASNGLFDLVVTSNSTHTEAVRQGKNCIEAGARRVRSQTRLRFDGSQYVVPKALQAQ